MTDLVALAMNYVATAQREQASEVAYLTAAGWKTTEIASRLGISWREVNTLRDATGDGVISHLRDAGYSDVELIRTLGVPTARVAGV
jgi:DNA-binding transcriptional regulator LsrR (DeoR family)